MNTWSAYFLIYTTSLYKYRLIHGHFHIGLGIIPRPPYWPDTESRANMGRGMITRPIWKCPCIKLFIIYFRHLEKRHPYWPETKSRPIWYAPIWSSIWKLSCSNPITIWGSRDDNQANMEMPMYYSVYTNGVSSYQACCPTKAFTKVNLRWTDYSSISARCNNTGRYICAANNIIGNTAKQLMLYVTCKY
jgi:hypothetical protein